jgi:hypothetical protein
MRSRCRSVFAAALAMLALSAVVTTAAQAAEGPFYKIAGTRLGAGQTKEIKAKARESFILSTELAGTVTCSSMTYASGATITGSNGGTASGGEQTIEFSGCTVAGNGSPCELEGKAIKTPSVKSVLGYATSTRTGKVLALLKPATGTVLLPLHFVGVGCRVHELFLEGSLIVEVRQAKAAIEVGAEHEAKVNELTYPQTRILKLWVESEGKLKEEKAKTVLPFSLFGGALLELTSGETWGAFTS